MKSKQLTIWSIFIYFAFWLSTTANADMMISPTRVLLNDESRSATMTLRNTSEGPRTYRLSWEDKRATETGSYTEIVDGEAWPSAQDMIRFSPRQITVGPGENQTIRFSFRPPADLTSGEYRSHLLLKVIPDISEPSSTLTGTGPGENVGVQVFMQMSFSIPVVARFNTGEPQVSIEEVKAVPVEDGKRLGLELTFNRVGDSSSFGTVTVEMQRDATSQVEQIGQYKELSIFRELDRRKITIPLREKNIPKGAVVRVAYEGAKEYKGKVWAEKIFQTE